MSTPSKPPKPSDDGDDRVLEALFREQSSSSPESLLSQPPNQDPLPESSSAGFDNRMRNLVSHSGPVDITQTRPQHFQEALLKKEYEAETTSVGGRKSLPLTSPPAIPPRKLVKYDWEADPAGLLVEWSSEAYYPGEWAYCVEKNDARILWDSAHPEPFIDNGQLSPMSDLEYSLFTQHQIRCPDYYMQCRFKGCLDSFCENPHHYSYELWKKRAMYVAANYPYGDLLTGIDQRPVAVELDTDIFDPTDPTVRSGGPDFCDYIQESFSKYFSNLKALSVSSSVYLQNLDTILTSMGDPMYMPVDHGVIYQTYGSMLRTAPEEARRTLGSHLFRTACLGSLELDLFLSGFEAASIAYKAALYGDAAQKSGDLLDQMAITVSTLEQTLTYHLDENKKLLVQLNKASEHVAVAIATKEKLERALTQLDLQEARPFVPVPSSVQSDPRSSDDEPPIRRRVQKTAPMEWISGVGGFKTSQFTVVLGADRVVSSECVGGDGGFFKGIKYLNNKGALYLLNHNMELIVERCRANPTLAMALSSTQDKALIFQAIQDLVKDIPKEPYQWRKIEIID